MVTNASINESFGAWVAGLFVGPTLQILVVYLVIGILGIFSHYLKKYLEEEISGSLWKYLYGDHPRRTLITLVSFIGSGIAYVFTGMTDGVTWPALIGLAFTTGYSFDSMFNKGEKGEA